MKLLTYNVNGIRSAIKKGFLEWLQATEADIICLQEIKANPDQLDFGLFYNLGYEVFWYPAEKKGYSGVAILSKLKPIHVEYGCGIPQYDAEGRTIRLDFADFSGGFQEGVDRRFPLPSVARQLRVVSVTQQRLHPSGHSANSAPEDGLDSGSRCHQGLRQQTSVRGRWRQLQ